MFHIKLLDGSYLFVLIIAFTMLMNIQQNDILPMYLSLYQWNELESFLGMHP